ncbi:hypothetical protein LXL04_033951 [Taraxacum kok-saghyz]
MTVNLLESDVGVLDAAGGDMVSTGDEELDELFQEKVVGVAILDPTRNPTRTQPENKRGCRNLMKNGEVVMDQDPEKHTRIPDLNNCQDPQCYT